MAYDYVEMPNKQNSFATEAAVLDVQTGTREFQNQNEE